MSPRLQEQIARYKAARDAYYTLIAEPWEPMGDWLDAVEAKRVDRDREAIRLADFLADSKEDR